MNYQTENKIKELKQLIKNKTDFKDILKEKFGGAITRKNKWLSNNAQYFTDKELKYLEYQSIIEVIEPVAIEDDEPKETNLMINSFTTANIGALTPTEKTNMILNSDFLEILQKMANDYISQGIQNKKELVIPQEFFNLKDISIKNCRISNKIYNDFTEYAKANNITITALINYVLADFLDKNK